jgi:glycolate oxidase FAD binding subunit
MRIVGGGSWLDANRPVRADSMLVVRGLSGIVEYEPGDLTLTARAGTTLDAIAGATAVHGQWLALDPPGDPARATIGATIATASYGPLAHHFGTPRDMTLGVEMVTGVGDVVRAGGRVVKNVAGFDLTRLATGAWGTLGVLTEATVRLRAIPATQTTLAFDVPSKPQAIDDVRSALRHTPFIPLAATLVDRTAAEALGLTGNREVLLVRLGGNEAAVNAQRDQLRELGELREEDPAVWQRLRALEPASAASLRLSRLPSMIAQTWLDASRVASQWKGSFCSADLGRGIVRLVLPLTSEQSQTDFSSLLDVPFDGTRIYERLPAALWRRLSPAANAETLARGIKSAFDPLHLLNPGIFGEMN